MIFGEHLHAEEVTLDCACGRAAVVEVVDRGQRTWFCHRCAARAKWLLRRRQREESR
jgi:hypothetical protein